MRDFPVKTLSRVLSIAVYIFLFCNMVVLILLPFLLAKNYSASNYSASLLGQPGAVQPEQWGEYVLSVCTFYACGLASLVLLWQGRIVLRNLTTEKPFTMQNVFCMKRAAYCCFAISCAAFIRQMIWSFQDRFWWLFWHYNTLFIPFFLLAGLFCLLVAELFRQAAVLREDNSLVI